MNTNIPAYLLFVFCSSVLCCLLFALFSGRALKCSAGKATVLGGLTLLLGAVLGLAGAKLLYFLFRFTYILKTGFFGYLLSLNQNELSYYGGAAGVCLAVALSARIVRVKPCKALNAFAASGALLAALFRFAEYWLGALGTGDYLEQGLPFPFAVSEVWNPDFPEYYLAVFMLEGLIYLRVALFAFRCRKDNLCFIRTVFYLCLAQIICESMRAQSIRWLFVRYEQLLCYLIAEGILIWYAVAGSKDLLQEEMNLLAEAKNMEEMINENMQVFDTMAAIRNDFKTIRHQIDDCRSTLVQTIDQATVLKKTERWSPEKMEQILGRVKLEVKNFEAILGSLGKLSTVMDVQLSKLQMITENHQKIDITPYQVHFEELREIIENSMFKMAKIARRGDQADKDVVVALKDLYQNYGEQKSNLAAIDQRFQETNYLPPPTPEQ